MPSLRPRFRRALTLLPLLALTLLLGWLTASTSALRMRSGLWVAHTFEVLARIERSRAALEEVHPIARTPARQAVAKVREEAETLRRLTADNPVQQKAIRQFEKAFGVEQIQQASDVLDSMRGEEEKLLMARQIRWRDSVASNERMMGTAFIGMVLSLVGLGVLLWREERAQRKADAISERAKKRLESFTEAAFEGLSVSQNGCVIDANSAFLTMFGFPTIETLRGTPAERLAAPESRETVLQKRAVGSEEPYEALLQRCDGTTFPAELRGRKIEIDGKPARVTAIRDLTRQREAEREIDAHVALMEANQQLLDERLAEVAEMNVVLEAQRYQLRVANERLTDLATTDGLTGLKNQRTFRERLEEECIEAWRLNRELSLLMLDVDKFKSYNDTYGHPAGDEALRAVAAVLKEGAREYDLVARNGGEEFAVLLPGTNIEDAMQVAERIRKAVEAREWSLRPVTVSIGVATLLPSFGTGKEFVEAADRALYDAKEGGRNRVAAAQIAVPMAPAKRDERPYPIPANEAARLVALEESGVFHSGAEESFDTIAEAAALAMGVPTAVVSLIGKDEMWFKARVGIDVAGAGRDISFCTHAMLDERPTVVSDATLDPRFADNPLVTGDFGLRFYAGAPILTVEGLPLGTVCAVDRVPRQPTEEQLRMLERLARQAAHLIDAKRQVARLAEEIQEPVKVTVPVG